MQISKIPSDKSFSSFSMLYLQAKHAGALEPIIPQLIKLSRISRSPERKVSLIAQTIMQEDKREKDYIVRLPAIRFLASFDNNSGVTRLGESSVIIQKSDNPQYALMCSAYEALKNALKPLGLSKAQQYTCNRNINVNAGNLHIHRSHK